MRHSDDSRDDYLIQWLHGYGQWIPCGTDNHKAHIPESPGDVPHPSSSFLEYDASCACEMSPPGADPHHAHEMHDGVDSSSLEYDSFRVGDWIAPCLCRTIYQSYVSLSQ